ncbi:MAG: GNAT family N-acetyltransferase [bacterium]|nr:GNAT family N-acetyltransferase [bacterium]
MPYDFRPIEEGDLLLINRWLGQSYVQEFWDNSSEHYQDIQIFAQGRKVPSPYFEGCFSYWLGILEGQPFSLIMTSKLCLDDGSLPQIYHPFLCSKWKTYGLDFMIGETACLGKGFAAPTLKVFTDYFSGNIDPKVRSFIIDPTQANKKACEAYKKAGFQCVGEFTQDGGVFDQKEHFLMVKKVFPDPEVTLATKQDLPVFEALAPLYLYELSSYMEIDLFKENKRAAGAAFNLQAYFEDPKRHPFLIHVDGEIAGFALVHPFGLNEDIDWCLAEFFVLRKFQGTGVAEKAVKCLFEKFKGLWEITVPPENTRSRNFWKKTLRDEKGRSPKEFLKEVSFPSSKTPVWRVVFNYTRHK